MHIFNFTEKANVSLNIMNCIYIGHSLSGTIGLLASIRRSDIFSKIIFIGFSPR
ncbi:alpha/beta-Hydrolases superfamily protein [Perilla frutescens var. hirtella]|nr:alpha/beta-Hydrolases superfamily protein [Perilla frutescens var. hirtella]